MTVESLSEIIERLRVIHPFEVHQVDEKTGKTKPWYTISGDIVHDLIIREDNLREQVQVISSQIAYWGRIVALAKRVWEIREHEYRIWRDTLVLSLLNPAEKPDGWKRPTEKMVDATVRSDPEYSTHYWEQERAEEAHNSALAILEGFRVKKDALKFYVIRRAEDGAPTLSV